MGAIIVRTFLEIINEHIYFNKQIFKLAKSDLIKTYRGAALGWMWAIIKPVITLFVFWFAFVVGMRSGNPVNGYPYFLWLVAGFLPWFYISEMITQGAGCIRKYAHLVTKMKFPISVIPTFVSLSKLTVNLVLLMITIVIFMLFGYMPDIYMIQLPIYILIMFSFFSLWALFSGMLSAISKDFQNLVNACSNAVFWMSGIIYDVNKISTPWIKTLLKFNPVTVVANGYRNVFIEKQWFFNDEEEIMCFVVSFVVMFLLALWAYKKLRKDIPDVL